MLEELEGRIVFIRAAEEFKGSYQHSVIGERQEYCILDSEKGGSFHLDTHRR